MSSPVQQNPETEFILPPRTPDFSVMSRDALEDFAAHADYKLREILPAQESFETQVLNMLRAMRLAANSANVLRRSRSAQGGATPQCAALLACISRGKRSEQQIHDYIYQGRCEDSRPALKIIDVTICKLRHLLHPFGFEIMTDWGQGYSLRNKAAFVEAVSVFAYTGALPDLGAAYDPQYYAPMTPNQIAEIKQRRLRGEAINFIAAEMGVSPDTVKRRSQ